METRFRSLRISFSAAGLFRIPCHRVLAAGGKIGGFSAFGGVATKVWMLELEGVHLKSPQPTQQSFSF